MSRVYKAKLVYGIGAKEAEFHCESDKDNLVGNNSINNVEYFYEQNIFGEVVYEVEEDDFEIVPLGDLEECAPDEVVFSSVEGFKLYLVVDS